MLIYKKMKKLIQRFLVTTITFYFLISFYPGLTGPSNYQPLIIAASIYLFLELIIKPLLKVFLIPINILTFGLASFFVNIILLYIFLIIFPDINVVPFSLGPFQYNNITIPTLHFGYWSSLVLTSFLLSFSISFIQWILL